MTRASFSENIPVDTPCQCDNCEWHGRADQVDDISDIGDRLDPGGIVPAGQCPECHALAYIKDGNLVTGTGVSLA